MTKITWLEAEQYFRQMEIAKTEYLPIVQVSEKAREARQDLVIKELPLTIFLNDEELVTLLCTPENLKNLAVGFLYSEGILQSKEEIEKIALDEEKGLLWIGVKGDKAFVKKLMFKRLITSSCGKGTTFYNVVDKISCRKVESQTKISSQKVSGLMNRMQHQSQLYKATGGVHSAALCDDKNILIFSEDIGRHNAIDKIFGKCLLERIQTDDRIIITSGRISSEILLKIAGRNIPVIISRSAPTDLAVKLSGKLGITLIGFARSRRMNIYTNDWRVSDKKA